MRYSDLELFIPMKSMKKENNIFYGYHPRAFN